MSNPTPSFQPQDPHTNQPHQGQQNFGQQSSGPGVGSIEIPGKGTRTLASVGQRALARILDAVIAAVVGGIIGAILGVIIFAAAASGSETGSILTFGVSFVVILLIAIIGLAYETLMLTFYGATLGKMVMKIKVVGVETGENPQLLNALLRFALPGVMGLIPIVGGLAALACWLSPLFDSSGRQHGCHDMVATTVVTAIR